MNRTTTPIQIIRCTIALIFTLPLVTGSQVYSQSSCGTAGSINAGTNPLLDRNGDGYFSVYSSSGFVSANEEYLEFEILTGAGGADVDWTPLTGNEPDSDIQTGGGCGNTDLVTDANGGSDYAYYCIVDPDGLVDNGDEYLVFAIRVADKTSGAFGFSFLMDSDNNCNTADPNNVCGNPCFEYEIQLATNNSGGSVKVFDVDGCTGTANCDLLAGGSADVCAGNCNTGGLQVCAGSTNCPTGDPVFWIFHLNFSDLPGVKSTDDFSLTPASTTSGNSVLYKGTNVSDFGGVDDVNDIGGVCDCNNQCSGSSCADCLQDCLLACAASNNNVINPFPVVWTSFNLIQHPEGVKMAWKVLEFGDVNEYQIERSLAQMEMFEVVGRIPAKGALDGQEITYSYLDPVSVTGEYIYRIRMRELDGEVSLSPLASIYVDRQAQIQWNQTDKTASVFMDYDRTGVLSVYSLDGRELASYQVSGTGTTADLSSLSLPPGLLVLKLELDGLAPRALSVIW